MRIQVNPAISFTRKLLEDAVFKSISHIKRKHRKVIYKLDSKYILKNIGGTVIFYRIKIDVFKLQVVISDIILFKQIDSCHRIAAFNHKILSFYPADTAIIYRQIIFSTGGK